MLNYLERVRTPRATAPEARRAPAHYRSLALESLDTRLMLSAAPGDTIVTFNTNFGTFQVDLYSSTAPQTVANFLKYVDSGEYNNLIVQRIVAGFIAQTGGYTTAGAPFLPSAAPTHISTAPTDGGIGTKLPNEFLDSNLTGTLAMAKVSGDANSATSEFFFNLADNSSNLDTQNGGFTVFGEVMGNGMDVINAMAAAQNYDLSSVWGAAFANVPLQNFDISTASSVAASNFVVINSITHPSVTGTVYSDANGNGAQDAGDTALSGVTVYADINNNGTFDTGEASAVTDSAGNYTINNLAAGTYNILVAPLSGFTPVVATQSVTLTQAQIVSGKNFGEKLAAPDAPTLPANLDTGSSNTDEITKLTALQFLVTGVTSGATVQIYDTLNGTTLVGTAIANGTSVTITPTTPLAEGLHHLVATQTLNGVTSAQSLIRGVVIDTVAPQLLTTTLPTANTNSTYSYTLSTNDPGASTFSLVGAPTGLTIGASTGVLSWTTTNVPIGNYQFTVVATDTAGNASQKVYTLGVDGPLAFNAIGNQTVNQGATLTITPVVPSISTPLVYSLTQSDVPAGATFDTTTGKFTWSPTSVVAPGTYHITIGVTDSLNRTASSGSIAIVVNAPPVIAPIGNITGDEQTLISVPISIVDQGTVTLSFASAAPAGAAVKWSSQFPGQGSDVNNVGVFTWTPNEAQGPGTYTILVKATDAGGLSTISSFQVTVNEVDTAPSFGAMAPVNVVKGQTARVQIQATDSDLPAQQLIYSLDPGGPQGAQIDPQTGLLTWAVPTDFTPGIVTVNVRVTEVGGQGFSVAQAVALNVGTGFTGFDLFTTGAVSLGGFAQGLAIDNGVPINSGFSITPFGAGLPGSLPAQAAALAQLAGIPPIGSPSIDLGPAGRLPAGIVDFVIGFDSGVPHNTEGMEVEELARDTGQGGGLGAPGQPQKGDIQKAGAIENIDDDRSDGGSRGNSTQLRVVPPETSDTTRAAPFWGSPQVRWNGRSVGPMSKGGVASGPVANRVNATGRNMPVLPTARANDDATARNTARGSAAAAVLVLPLLVSELPERRRQSKRNRLGRWLEPLNP